MWGLGLSPSDTPSPHQQSKAPRAVHHPETPRRRMPLHRAHSPLRPTFGGLDSLSRGDPLFQPIEPRSIGILPSPLPRAWGEAHTAEPEGRPADAAGLAPEWPAVLTGLGPPTKPRQLGRLAWPGQAQLPGLTAGLWGAQHPETLSCVPETQIPMWCTAQQENGRKGAQMV